MTANKKEKNSEEETPETFVEEIMKGPESEVSMQRKQDKRFFHFPCIGLEHAPTV